MLINEQVKQLFIPENHAAAWHVIMEGAHPRFDTLRLLYEFESNPEWLPVFQSAHYEPIQQASPILFKPKNPESWLLHWQETFPDLDGSMLASAAPIAEVCTHLEGLASICLENRREVLFRFYDAWIMSALYPVLDNVERLKLHGPVNKWLWCTENAAIFSDELVISPVNAHNVEQAAWLTLNQKKVSAIQKGLRYSSKGRHFSH